MPHVTVNYVMYLPGGHHRQPRNTGVDLALAPTSGGDVPTGGSYTPTFFPTLPYTLGGGSGLATLIFWSVTDGTSGEVLSPAAFTQTVQTSPLTITAWYFPTTGPGAPGEPEIIDDAFSANAGAFIDDTFVDVTSDPSLTNQANVVGVVPTTSPETLVAHNNVVSTTEPFSKWVLNGGFMPAGATTLNVAKDTIGIAVAIYQASGTPTFKLPGQYVAYNRWWWIETHGGLVPPGPNPWEREFASALNLVDTARQASPQVRGRILEAALQQVNIAAASLKEELKGLQQKQG